MDSCPKCGREAEESMVSSFFPVYTCLEDDCGTKYCEECAVNGNCPECGSSDYGEYDKVYA